MPIGYTALKFYSMFIEAEKGTYIIKDGSNHVCLFSSPMYFPELWCKQDINIRG